MKIISNLFRFGLLAVVLLSGCASLPENTNRPESYFVAETQDTTLGQAVNERRESYPGLSGAFPLSSGLDAFVARAAVASYAEKTLDVQYYLYHNDKIGALLTDQLIQAANRGVRVRLLLDDMDLADRDFSSAMVDAHPNIEIRIFNPFSRNTYRATQFVTRFGGVTRRMHNKSFTVDNQVTIVGGRNIGDEYFDASKEYTFSDLDVMLIGPAVEEVSKSFDLYWNNAIVYPLATLVKKKPTAEEFETARQDFQNRIHEYADSEYMDALKNSELAQQIREKSIRYFWGDVDIIYDHPEKVIKSRDKVDYHLSQDLAKYFNAVEKEIVLISPYFVPGKSGVKFLTDLVKQGVKVTVITNSLSANDVPAVHAGYMKYRKPLIKGGIELYEFKTSLQTEEGGEQKYGDLLTGLHAKAFILDDKTTFIGSLNLDPRSAKENTEIGAMITNQELAETFYQELFENLQDYTYKVYLNEDKRLRWITNEDGEEKMFSKEPNTSWWQRFSVGAMRIIPAESQL